MKLRLLLDEASAESWEETVADGEKIRAELDVKPDLWFFACHFQGDPVMPGCLGLDAMWQLVGFYLGWIGGPGRGRALGVGEVKFMRGPGRRDEHDHLFGRADARRAAHLR